MADPKTGAEGGDDPAPKQPKPEEMGHDVAGAGEALEPESTRTFTDGAVKSGDRMWGPPGTPGRED